MKKIILIAVVVFIICSAFTVAESVFTQTGLTEKDLQKQVVNIALYGREEKNSTFFDFRFESSNIVLIRTFFKNGLDKKETADALIKYVKQYYNSDAFKQAYNAELAKQKPFPFYADTTKLWQQYDTDLKQLEKQYIEGRKAVSKEEYEKSTMSNLNSSDKGVDAAMKMLQNNPQLAAQSGLTPEQIQQMLQQAKAGMQEGKDGAQQGIDKEFTDENAKKREAGLDAEFKKEKEKLLASYQKQAKDLTSYLLHADAKANLKAALINSTAIINTVDFDAKLNGRKFARDDYEKKDNRWKYIYRAGKANADIARAAAAQWLSELK